MNALAVKRCSKCHLVKPVGEFYRHSRSTDGFNNPCIACSKIARAGRSGRTYRPCACGCERLYHRDELVNPPAKMRLHPRGNVTKVWIGCVERWRNDNQRRALLSHSNVIHGVKKAAAMINRKWW